MAFAPAFRAFTDGSASAWDQSPLLSEAWRIKAELMDLYENRH
jgi:hypothetical protein